MESVSFKQRVIQQLILCSVKYKENFLDFDYLICSYAFKQKNYYVINAHKDNFQHLSGVHSLIEPNDFFDKCYNATFSEEDFDFLKKGQTEKTVKGSVRRKMSVLPLALDIFNQSNILVEENFKKNRIFCSFATTDNVCTFGFIDDLYSVPKTLLKSNELNPNNSHKVDLILRKKKTESKFDELHYVNNVDVSKYIEKIKDLISDKLVAYLSQQDIK